jgi:hypothetical protein
VKRLLRGSLTVLAACAAAVVSPALALAAAGPMVTRVADGSGPVSITSNGGVVALYSDSNLDPSNGGDRGGVFLYNTATGAFARQSTRLPDGTFATAFAPVIAAGGSELAVVSADPLAGESSGGGGIYVRDLPSGAFRLVAPGVFPYGRMAISRDGSVLAYVVSSGGSYQLFILSTRGGSPTLVDSSAINEAGSLSGDGRFLAFTKKVTGLYRVVVRDARTGAIQVASSDSAGNPGTGGHASISSDGRFVAFRSADTLVPDSGVLIDVYTKDRATGETTLASTTVKERLPVGTASPGGDYCCSPTSISSDGRFVAFTSAAPLTPAADGTTALFVKDRRTSAIVRVALGAAANLEEGDLALSGDGHTLVFKTRARGTSATSTGEIELARIPPGSSVCDQLGPPVGFGLSRDEERLLRLELAPTKTEAAAARSALATDARRHRRNRSVDARDLRELNSILRSLRPQATSAQADVPKLIDDAKCSLLKQARDSLVDSLEKTGHGSEAKLADKLLALRDVFEGTADATEKAELLKANVTELIERIGGTGAAKKYAGVITEIYGLVDAHLSGTLKEGARKSVEKQLIKLVKKAAKSYFGSEASDLVEHLLSLRDVIAGSPSDAQKFQVLKDSIAGLSLTLLGKNLLKTPQVRAAMLGFELGRAFGNRIAEDLNLISTLQLEKDCAAALAAKQKETGGGFGTVDYSEATQATVPKPLWHEGWHCVIEPDGFVPGYPGGVVQATRPANASLKDKILWRITTTGDALLYDPHFAHG